MITCQYSVPPLQISELVLYRDELFTPIENLFFCLWSLEDLAVPVLSDSYYQGFLQSWLLGTILFYIGYKTSEHQLDHKLNNGIKLGLNPAQEISETQEFSWGCPSSFHHLAFSLSYLSSDWGGGVFLHIFTQEANTSYHLTVLPVCLLTTSWNIYCCFLYSYILRVMGFVYFSIALSRRMYLHNLTGMFFF